MQDFEQALDLTLDALSAMKQAGRRARASLSSIDAITKTSRPPVLRPPAPSVLQAGAAQPPSVPAPGQGAEPEGFADLRQRVLACTLCPHLVASRTSVVFGVGNPSAELMFVGEAPGADEDAAGEPFVGKAGRLLTKIIQAMGFERSDVFIANVLKCRPNLPVGSTGNRRPTPHEMATCLPYLREQIALVQPRAIVALGAVAMEGLFGKARPIGSLRGRWHDLDGLPVMATYHPAYLLRNQANSEKRKVWEDMLAVLEFLERNISPKQYAYFTEKG